MGTPTNQHPRQVRLPVALISFGTSESVLQVCQALAQIKTCHLINQDYGQKIWLTNDQSIEIELREGIGTLYCLGILYPDLFECLVKVLAAVPKVEILERFL
ncbi:MAG: hypothetical protein ACFFBD_08065 [Candidatus Hodarchaeota archaeon]